MRPDQVKPDQIAKLCRQTDNKNMITRNHKMYETQQTTIISIIITSPDNPSGIFYVSLTVNSKLEFLTISVKILDFGIKT